jgi:hypothetical protein
MRGRVNSTLFCVSCLYSYKPEGVYGDLQATHAHPFLDFGNQPTRNVRDEIKATLIQEMSCVFSVETFIFLSSQTEG